MQAHPRSGRVSVLQDVTDAIATCRIGFMPDRTTFTGTLYVGWRTKRVGPANYRRHHTMLTKTVWSPNTQAERAAMSGQSPTSRADPRRSISCDSASSSFRNASRFRPHGPQLGLHQEPRRFANATIVQPQQRPDFFEGEAEILRGFDKGQPRHGGGIGPVPAPALRHRGLQESSPLVVAGVSMLTPTAAAKVPIRPRCSVGGESHHDLSAFTSVRPRAAEPITLAPRRRIR